METESVFLMHDSCDKCGSSDAKAIYEVVNGSGTTSYCFNCKHYDSDKVSVDSMRKSNPKEKFDWKTFMKKNTRPITIDYRVPCSLSKEYGLRESVDQERGTVDTVYFPIVTAGKVTAFKAKRIAGEFDKKKKWMIYGKIDKGSLFGINQCKGTRLIIVTEGENDCLSAKQMLRNKGKDYSVVSIPNGASGAAKAFSADIPEIEGAEKIILNFDMDGAGADGANSCVDLLGAEKTYMMKMSLKDASEMLAQGRQDEYMAAMFNAQKPAPAGIVELRSVIGLCLTQPTMGIPWPWKGLNDVTYGIQPRSLVTIGAAPKSGKTDSQFQIAAHLIKKCEMKVGIFNLEDPAHKTYNRVAEKFVGKNFHIPDAPFERDILEKALHDIDDSVMIYGSDGSRDFAHIERTMLYMINAGVKVIMLDNLTALISQASSSEANDMLNKIMTRLAYLREKYEVSILSYSHVNPAKGGTPHDWGGPIFASQFTGSRAAQKWSTQGITILRNQHPELDEQDKNLGQMQVIMDREFGRTGLVNLEYSYETTLFTETDRTMVVGDPTKKDKEDKDSKKKFQPMKQPRTDDTTEPELD